MNEKNAIVRFPREVELDAVTGLPQRKSLDGDLPSLLRCLGPEGLPMSAVMVDIDHFKKFNDQWGHDIGDKVLRHVAGLIRESVRYRGEAYRYGGEEITVLLPNTTSSEGLATAERVCRLVGRTPMAVQEKSSFLVTVSAGVASTEMVSGDQLLVSADKALLRAKNQGRNRALLFEEGVVLEKPIKIDVTFPAFSSVKVGEDVLLKEWITKFGETTNIEARRIFLVGAGVHEIAEGGVPREMAEAEVRGRVTEVERVGSSSTSFTLEVEGEIYNLMVRCIDKIGR